MFWGSSGDEVILICMTSREGKPTVIMSLTEGYSSLITHQHENIMITALYTDL